MDSILGDEGRLQRRNFDISFNELYDMYREKELIIQPEFQRLFRWSEKQQSLFIESLLLDMPIPPIYVDEREDGSYVLVDGLQRISSYLNFRGVQLETSNNLEVQVNEENSDEQLSYVEDLEIMQNVPPSFKLKGCEIRKELNGKSYNDLSIIERRNLKRVFIRVEVLTKNNNNSVKYHMFKRLNSGGELLSDQELRNSNIRMIDKTFINFINSLADNKNYLNLTQNMTQKDKYQMKRSENVLRYFLFKNKFLDESYTKDSFRLSEELTKFLEEVTEGVIDFNYEGEQQQFENLVQYLDENFGPDIFGGINKTSDKVTKSFVQYNYDGFMLYFSSESNQNNAINLDDISNIKKRENYLQFRTGGIDNVKSRIESIKKELESEFS